MQPYLAETGKMGLFAYISLLELVVKDTWSSCAPACSYVDCQIYACLGEFSLRIGWTGFVEAPTAPGGISPLEAKWICGNGRLFQAIYKFPQDLPPLLTRLATDNSLPLQIFSPQFT